MTAHTRRLADLFRVTCISNPTLSNAECLALASAIHLERTPPRGHGNPDARTREAPPDYKPDEAEE